MITVRGGESGLTAPVLTMTLESASTDLEGFVASAPGATCTADGTTITCTLEPVEPGESVEVTVQVPASTSKQALIVHLADGERGPVAGTVAIGATPLTLWIGADRGTVASGEAIPVAFEPRDPYRGTAMENVVITYEAPASGHLEALAGCEPSEGDVVCTFERLQGDMEARIAGAKVVGNDEPTTVTVRISASNAVGEASTTVQVERELLEWTRSTGGTLGNASNGGFQVLATVGNADATRTIEGIVMRYEVTEGTGRLTLNGNTRCELIHEKTVQCTTVWDSSGKGPDYERSTLAPGAATTITGVRYVGGTPGDVVQVTISATNAPGRLDQVTMP